MGLVRIGIITIHHYISNKAGKKVICLVPGGVGVGNLMITRLLIPDSS